MPTNIHSDYWSENPEMALIFDDFKSKKDSSKIMWCIYMYYDPRSVEAMELDDAKRLVHIKKFYGFIPENYIDISDRYVALIPEIEITYFSNLRDYQQLSKYINNIPIIQSKGKNKGQPDLDNIDLKITYGNKLESLLKKNLALKQQVLESRASTSNAKKARGGYNRSRSEAGGIGS